MRARIEVFGALASVVACATSEHGAHEHVGHEAFADAERWASVFDDPARDAWQQPAEVMRALELTPTSVVADIGAGTGYFAMRLARAVPDGKVFASDISPDMVRHLAERARREQLDNVVAVLATTGQSLAPQSVDRVLVVHVWHHLADRAAQARELAAALRPGGRLVIVEFSLTAERGPPPGHRLAPEAVIADLTAAGLVARLSPIALPDQYMVAAERR